MPAVSLRKLAIIVLVVLVVPVGLLWAGVTLFADDSSGAERVVTRLDHAIATGELPQMLDRHQAMMEAMRVNVTPEMQSAMDADQMWQLMRTGEFAALMEEHQDQINRMLGQGC